MNRPRPLSAFAAWARLPRGPARTTPACTGHPRAVAPAIDLEGGPATTSTAPARTRGAEVRTLVGVALALGACAAEPTVTAHDAAPAAPCDETHPRVGQVATLIGHSHGVAGLATIVDACTIEVTSFDFDGDGLDVRFYGGLGGAYDEGFALGEDLRRPSVYRDATLTVPLPDGTSLDDLDGLSVWCVPAGVSFGDGRFEPPT